jgi:hypothetical protein
MAILPNKRFALDFAASYRPCASLQTARPQESADTPRELGVEPIMTMATVKRQREMGQIASSSRCERPIAIERTRPRIKTRLALPFPTGRGIFFS